ncbi:MAG: hypothetical protein VW891_14660 [Novosphingobium sp.]
MQTRFKANLVTTHWSVAQAQILLLAVTVLIPQTTQHRRWVSLLTSRQALEALVMPMAID